MPKRARKPVDDDSDASTERAASSDEERRPTSKRAKGKKRVSEIHPDTVVPLNDIQNAGDTESDDEQGVKRPSKILSRKSTIDMNDDNAEKRKRRKSAKQSVSFINPLDASEREAARKARDSRGNLNPTDTPEKTASGSGPRTPKMSALARANQLTAVAQTPVPAVPVDILNSKYEEWMKMATDNKINANNAWNFALIDYFQDMSLLRNELDNSINFQKASFTLDGCVKIWTSRVDSVGTETGKLLSNLADEIRGAKESEDHEDGQDDDGEGKAKKTKTHRSETTLAKSFAQLQVKKLDLEFTVDPLFKKTCADFDEGGAMGLLMNHLGVDEKIRVVFDAGDSRLEGVDEETPDVESVPIDLTELRTKFIPTVDTVLTKTISESLAEFHFSKDSSVDITSIMDSFNRDYEANQTGDAGSEGGFDDDAPAMNDDFGNDGGFGGDDAPPAEDFFTGDQAIEEGFVANNAAYGGGGPGPVPLGPVENFDPRRLPSERDLVMAMTEDGEEMLDYFDATVMKNWAGPQHWKLRRLAKKDTSVEGNTTGRTRKEKVAFEIDFSAPSQPSKELFAPATGATIVLPAGTGAMISAPTAGKRKSKKASTKRDNHLLPDDMHFTSAQLLRLFRKPKFSVSDKDAATNRSATDEPLNCWIMVTNMCYLSSKCDATEANFAFLLDWKPSSDDGDVVVDTYLVDIVGEDGDGEIDERFWANAAAAHAEQGQENEEGDDTGAIPFNTQFLNDDDYDDTAGFGDDGQSILPQMEEEDLLAATQGTLKRTRPEFVNYAKKAKRVDVRKLKENIWKSLEIVTGHAPEGEDEDMEDLDASKAPTDPQEAREFSNVLTNLETAYPREKMDEISTSFCFICLLHLANEQGLKIEVDPKEKPIEPEVVDDDLESSLRVGDIYGLKVYRDPNATRAA